MTRVLVLTTEPLPYRGLPTTGAGLRAWGIAEGLRASRLDVTVAMPRDAVEGKNIEDPSFSPEKNTFSRNKLTEFVNNFSPEVIVFQHWGLMRELKHAPCPIALDLAGPHLLERYYWSGGGDAPTTPTAPFATNLENDLTEKLQALRRADFVCCSGKLQRLYFLPYLQMAGYKISAETLRVIPFSIAPTHPPGIDGDRDPKLFVYGGFFLPWQNPTRPLQWLLETFDECEKGKLDFYGGMHPAMDVSRGKFDTLLQKLTHNPRVKMKGILPFDKLCEEYVRASVALDLFERNPERELAFTTRTVVYMWCGLPVIYNNYSELSGYIKRSGAGWTLDPSDEATFKNIVRAILEGKSDIEEKRKAARELVAQELNWTRTIRPLGEFCKSPHYREGKAATALAFETRTLRIAQLERELENTRSELLTLRGKLWYRLYRKFGTIKPILAPFIFLLALPICLLFLLCFFLIDLFSPKPAKDKQR